MTKILKHPAALLGLVAAVILAGLCAAPAYPAGLEAVAALSVAERLDIIGPLAIGGLIVNGANLNLVYTGFNAAFMNGLGQATPQWGVIATRVPSATSEEKYGWLGKIASMREWIGARVHHNLMQHDYAIKNKDYELTVDVGRNEIEDDQYGVYAPVFSEMGASVAAQPDLLVWPLLKAGFAGTMGLCYDGQYFFDTDHPVIDENGVEQSVANTDGGSGAPWFLMDSRGMMKPIIYQVRKEPSRLTRMDADDDRGVFENKTFTYGVDGRMNVGFGFWQKIWGSKQALDQAHYKTARDALNGMKGDHGRPLGIMPDTLVVGPTNEQAGLELVNSERNAAGATNVYKGTAKLVVVPWLA